MAAFADDNFTIAVAKNKMTAKTQIELSLTNISHWMKDSGLKINEAKTEACVFSRTDTAIINISVNGVDVRTKTEIMYNLVLWNRFRKKKNKLTR